MSQVNVVSYIFSNGFVLLTLIGLCVKFVYNLFERWLDFRVCLGTVLFNTVYGGLNKNYLLIDGYLVRIELVDPIMHNCKNV